MRIMLFITFPTEKFNAALRDGSLREKFARLMAATRPEAAYFGAHGAGKRGAILVVDVPSADKVPAITEPWYLTFDADVETRTVMTAEDIASADLEDVVEKFG